VADQDPKDYLAMLALGLGASSQPHVWERPRRLPASGEMVWSCKFCSTAYSVDKADERCPEHPKIVARPGG